MITMLWNKQKRSVDDFHSGHHKQSFSGLHSPGRSSWTIKLTPSNGEDVHSYFFRPLRANAFNYFRDNVQGSYGRMGPSLFWEIFPKWSVGLGTRLVALALHHSGESLESLRERRITEVRPFQTKEATWANWICFDALFPFGRSAKWYVQVICTSL